MHPFTVSICNIVTILLILVLCIYLTPPDGVILFMYYDYKCILSIDLHLFLHVTLSFPWNHPHFH